MVLHRLVSVVAIVLLTTLLFNFNVPSRQVRATWPIELVPAYFYPIGAGLAAWNQLADDAGSIRVEAILNPASGPGATRDPKYVAVVNKLRKAGGSVFGYVSTEYGKRDSIAVHNDIYQYMKFYQINGIFIDEMAANPENCSYYEKIYQFIKAMDSNFKVVGNPGTPYTVESYLAAADTLVIFEGPDTAYAEFKPLAVAPWIANHPAHRFANIVYAVTTDATLNWALDKARQSNAGSIFITDGGLPNPYAGLPPYWAREVAAIRTSDLTVPPRPKNMTMKQAGGKM